MVRNIGQKEWAEAMLQATALLAVAAARAKKRALAARIVLSGKACATSFSLLLNCAVFTAII